MAKRPLPVPITARPLPLMDPLLQPDGFVAILSEVYHAEKAALRGFIQMGDPTFAQHSDLFAKARSLLVQEEAAHMKDFEDIMRILGAGEVPPPCAEAQELWKMWDPSTEWNGFPLPVSASIV